MAGMGYNPKDNSGFGGPMTGQVLANAYSNYMPQANAPSNRVPTIGRNAVGGSYISGYQDAPADPMTQQFSLYNKGVEQNAEDYGSIMGGYKDLLSKANSQPMMQNPATYNPSMASYNASPDYTNAMSNMKGLADSGGYSTGDIQSLRERGVSPIRSIYAGAQRDIDRKRRLGGGFSPNYNATTSKMAREQSDLISGRMNDVNAGIAERVAQNKLSIAPQYANIAQSENQFRNNMDVHNADTQNQAQQFNIDMPFKVGQYNQGNMDSVMRALQGMTSLYGTTPAMSSLFGNQAMNLAQFNNQMSQQGQNNNMNAALATLRQM